MLFRVLDIETVPDLTVWTPGKVKWRASPGLRDDRSCHLFKDEHGGGYTPCDVLYEPEEPFPPPQAHRVVAISWCDVLMSTVADAPKTYDLQDLQYYADWPDDRVFDLNARERQLILRFRDAMVTRPATLVTWNGRTFDLPVLAARALHLGVPWGWYYEDGYRYRYAKEGTYHLDLMDVLSDYGAARSMKLGDAARLVGLPGKDVPGEEHFDGSMVASVVAQGNLTANKAKVARYCAQDVVQTALLFLRTRYHLEIVTAEEHDLSLKSFEASAAVAAVLPLDWEKSKTLSGAVPWLRQCGWLRQA